MEWWTHVLGWEVRRMNKVLLVDDKTISEEILNIDPSEFQIVEKEEVIYDAKIEGEAISYIRDVWKRFKSSKVTVVATLTIILIILLGIVGPYINDFTYIQQDVDRAYLPPRIPRLEKIGIFDGTKVISIQKRNLENYEDYIIKIVDEYEIKSRTGMVPMLDIKIDAFKQKDAQDIYYWFGSDSLGRDMFTRLWMGTRVSLILAFSVMLVNLSIGLVVGAVAGYYGGWIDILIQRLLEIITSIPQLPLTLLLIMWFGSGIIPLIVVFVLTGWVGISNSVRIQFYRYKNMEYVLASRTMGASDRRIMYKYILPNAAGTIITNVALTLPFVIFQEAGLSYLGLGIQAPDPSIGQLLSDGQKVLLEYPYLLLFPGLIIILLMLSFNLLGNGLRDAFNPDLRQ